MFFRFNSHIQPIGYSYISKEILFILMTDKIEDMPNLDFGIFGTANYFAFLDLFFEPRRIVRCLQ